MAEDNTDVLIADASVLLRMKHLGVLDALVQFRKALSLHFFVTEAVLHEVELEIRQEELAQRGVDVIQQSFSIIAKMKELRDLHVISKRLSDADAEMFVISLENKCMLWTDDNRLLETSHKNGVRAIRLFNPFCRLVESGILLPNYVYSLGSRLCEFDERFTVKNLAELKIRLGL